MSATGAGVAEIMQHYYPGAALQSMRELKVAGS
jgi:peptidoglycan hydrolase-like amidase